MRIGLIQTGLIAVYDIKLEIERERLKVGFIVEELFQSIYVVCPLWNASSSLVHSLVHPPLIVCIA